MTTARKPARSAVVLELLLIVAIVAVAYGQVFVPLTSIGGLKPLTGRYVPSIEVTLDLRTALKEQTNPYRFPDMPVGTVITSADGLEFGLPTRTFVEIWAPDARQRVAGIGTRAIRGLLAIAILMLLLLMVRTLRSGDPFVPANARRMYAIAATVGIGLPLADLLDQWGRHGILDNPRVAPFVMRESYHLSLLPIAIGLAIAVAAEVFRQGSSLRADVDGLV